jgi:hypothetical protein
MINFKTTRFKNPPKETFFAPEWDCYIFESYIDQVNFIDLSKFILSKEEEILKLPLTRTSDNLINDGNTGLGENSTTVRFANYNVLNWENENIKLLKEFILNFHNEILNKLKLQIPNELYIQCWANIMRNGEQIKPHLHTTDPTTYLGGHISVQCDNTSTHYMNPVNQINDPPLYKIKNEVGKITLFQNNIPHYTDVHSSNVERITIAFDLTIHKPYRDNYLRLI